MIIVCDTPNGHTVQAVGTDGKLYSFWGRRPMPRTRADTILQHPDQRNDSVKFCRCPEDVADALAAWQAGER